MPSLSLQCCIFAAVRVVRKDGDRYRWESTPCFSVNLHSIVEVSGIPLSDRLRAAFAEWGFTAFEQRITGF